jgi:hypothetical protein
MRESAFRKIVGSSVLVLILAGCGAQSYVMKVISEAPVVCKKVIGSLGVKENTALRWNWESSSHTNDADETKRYNEVMSAPMVADLNGDGVGDIVVGTFTTQMALRGRTGGPGVLRVISGADGKELASTSPNSTAGSIRPYANSMVAIFDLDESLDADGKKHPEILVYAERSSQLDTYPTEGGCSDSTVCHNGSSGLAIYQLIKNSQSQTGFELKRQAFVELKTTSDLGVQHIPISAHRIFHDDKIYVEAYARLWLFNKTDFSLSAYVDSVLGVMDLRSDRDYPGMEIITFSDSGGTEPNSSIEVKSADLTKSYNFTASSIRGRVLSASSLAFAQFRPGPGPQVVVKFQSNVNSIPNPSTGVNVPTNQPFGIAIYQGSTGELLTEWKQSDADFASCRSRFSGPYTSAFRNASVAGAINVGDITGDKIPDLTLAGACKFYALKSVVTEGSVRLETQWANETFDISSAQTGSSNFDFNGDGEMEVLYNDERKFRIYDGKTGEVRAVLANNTGTVFEYPVVVSLRPNEPASIVLAANRYPAKLTGGVTPDSENKPYSEDVTGIRIIQAKEWMPSRPFWNQYLYTITNANEDLSVPRGQMDFASKSNMTRANVQGGEYLKKCLRDESQRPPTVIIVSE